MYISRSTLSPMYISLILKEGLSVVISVSISVVSRSNTSTYITNICSIGVHSDMVGPAKVAVHTPEGIHTQCSMSFCEHAHHGS